MFATAATFLKNFSVPCLYVAIAAAVMGGGLSSCVTKKLTEGRALKAETELANYRADVAEQTSAAVNTALTQEREARKQLDDKLKRITDGLRAGDAAIVTHMEGLRRDLTRQLQTSLAAPEWACLQRPLPDDTLGLFDRPGT